ncbi:MAG: pyridoxine 5'-phosphate synthase [Salinisphaeraceae bacterium]|nr:pyridoxine 5'-phosphate synthase [Salinisphaeraceae bacterium]
MTDTELRLGVNIDHVATLRQVRGTDYPDVLAAARLALQAGAHSITVHLREDRRHIQDHDVEQLVREPGLKLNLELAVNAAMLDIAERLAPDFICFVPERREELTTEGGLDVVGHQAAIEAACRRFAGAGIRVSLFIEADEAQIRAAHACGAHCIEIHTGGYADATDKTTRQALLSAIRKGAQLAHSLGLEVHAGHGLHVGNVAPVAAIPEVVELNIGHALVARSVFVGLGDAVREMAEAMRTTLGRDCGGVGGLQAGDGVVHGRTQG